MRAGALLTVLTAMAMAIGCGGSDKPYLMPVDSPAKPFASPEADEIVESAGDDGDWDLDEGDDGDSGAGEAPPAEPAAKPAPPAAKPAQPAAKPAPPAAKPAQPAAKPGT
jgi:hypothetical protein